jgi:hypothetical protein
MILKGSYELNNRQYLTVVDENEKLQVDLFGNSDNIKQIDLLTKEL